MSEAPLPSPHHRRRQNSSGWLTLLIRLPVFALVAAGTYFALESMKQGEATGEDPETAASLPDSDAAAETDDVAQNLDAFITEGNGSRAQAINPEVLAQENARLDAVFGDIGDLPRLEATAPASTSPTAGPSYAQILADQRLWPEVLLLTEPHSVPIRTAGQKVGEAALPEGTELRVVKILPQGYLMVRAEAHQFVVPVFKTNLDFIPDPEGDAGKVEDSAALARSRPQDHVAVLLANPDAPDAAHQREAIARQAILDHAIDLTRSWGQNTLGVTTLKMENGILEVRLQSEAYAEAGDLTYLARQIARYFVDQAQSWGADLNYAMCRIRSADGSSTVAIGSYRGAYVEATETP